MRHNPPLWQEQLLMELLSDLRSQGGIISAFILPIPIVMTLKNRVLMECMTQQRRRGAGDSTRRAAGGAKSTHEHYVRHPHQITTILSSSCLKIFFLPQKNQKKVPWLVVQWAIFVMHIFQNNNWSTCILMTIRQRQCCRITSRIRLDTEGGDCKILWMRSTNNVTFNFCVDIGSVATKAVVVQRVEMQLQLLSKLNSRIIRGGAQVIVIFGHPDCVWK